MSWQRRLDHDRGRTARQARATLEAARVYAHELDAGLARLLRQEAARELARWRWPTDPDATVGA